MATVPADIEGPSDAELIDAVRKGTVSAYGSLYERHVAAAYNLARQLSRSPAESDDLVSEAFAKVLDTLRAGRGPDSAFRAYLLTALRHTAYDKTRRDRKVELSDDVESAGGAAVAQPFSDTAVAGLERSLAAQAFARLPERWQAVLWHTEIERQPPAEVAPILGLTPNGVSALAYRAREGLRQAYLQVHLSEITDSRCRAAAERLGAFTRSGLAKREKAQVEAHLDECARCRALAAELADVNGAMREVVAPLVLGAGALGYLTTTTQGTAVVVATAAGAAGAGGAAAGAAAAGPRQLAGAAVAGVAAAIALVIGLTSGGEDQQVPTAAPTQQAPPAQQPPQQQPPTQDPAPPAQQPPPQQAPPPAQQPPQQQPVPVPEPTPRPPQQLPSPPALRASPPANPVDLVAGGDSADLPITVTNTGGSLSAPVAARLNLPPGVRAIEAAPDGFAGSRPLALDAPRRGAGLAGTVNCPAGTGTATCANPTGLRPAETITLRFRLVADADSSGGVITGTVSAGTAVNVRIQVRVQVTPPVAVDGVELTEVRWGGLLPGIWPYPKLAVRVKNTGTSSLPVTVSIDQPGMLVGYEQHVSCTASVTPVCTTTAELAPGEELGLRFRLHHHAVPFGHHDDPSWQVSVQARLGAATDSAVLGLPPGWHHPVPDPPTPPTGPSTTPTPPSVTPPTVTPPPVSTPHRPSTPDRPSATTPAETPAPTTTAPTTTESVPTGRAEPEPTAPPDQGGSGLGSLLDWLFGRGR